MGCATSTQARSPDRRFRDPTPHNQQQQQAHMGAYPSAPPQPQYYGQPVNGQMNMASAPFPTQGYYQGQNPPPTYNQAMAPQGDPAYPPPPPQYPPPQQPNYGPQPPPPVQRPYPVQHGVPMATQQQTTVIVRERRHSHDGGLALVGGLAMGAMMGAALHGSFSSLSSGFSFD